MKPRDFINIYHSDEQIKNIVGTIKNPGTSAIFIKGVTSSSTSIISSAISTSLPNSSLCILPDRESAIYFFNDIENILEEKKLPPEKRSVFFLPSSYKKPFERPGIDNNNVLMRSEIINRLSFNNNKTRIVTYPEALIEKVISKTSLRKNTIQLKKGESTSVDFLLDLLIDYGFERVDFTIEPGQFSIRGGIIDIFSFADEHPYRIEIMGNTIESLRTFNPETQLTIKLLDNAEILPDTGKIRGNKQYENFLSIIPSNTIIWVEDVALTQGIMNKNFDKATEIFDSLTTTIGNLNPNDLFISGSSFSEKIQEYIIIEFGKRYFAPENMAFEFNFSLQPSFNKNFELLRNNLHENTSKGYKNLILSDNPNQIERLHNIFDTLSKDGTNTKNFSHDILMIALQQGFIDHNNKIACYTDHQLFERYHRYRLRDRLPAKQAFTIKEFSNLKPGDYVTHIDHGVGIFSGLEKIEVNGKVQEAIRLVYKGDDILYISIHSLHRIAKYSGKEGTTPSLNKLGTNTWKNLKKRTKQKVKDIAEDLIKIYAKRKSNKGISFSPDTSLQNELEASFIYEDTPDQVKATANLKKDMEAEYPMDRLICGDVGFGKTEVAIRAAFKAITDNKQVAVLVPTTILALQHYHTFTERLKGFPCNIDYINRFRSSKEKKQIINNLKEGKTDIIIGTHRIVSKDIKFKDLGLLIIDEEQKFGVSIKEKLKTMSVNVDSLTLTATPIPRTLQFSLMGARDLSLINTPPPNRYPIITELHVFNKELIKDAIMHEISRGGQVFFVHNRVQNIMEMANIIQNICPGISIGVGHGQMDGVKLEKTMIDFINGEHDVLVSTSIVESGLDIPNANTIIINNAHHFGLSDLHQMRGRVGRTNKKAFCYLLAPPLSTLADESRKRLKALEEFSELGSGFNIAMRDLDIRGAGNILGAEQSGFINEIGFETYHKILNEAMTELKEKEFKNVFDVKEEEDTEQVKKNYSHECLLETDLELLIPNYYVSSVKERLILYKELDNIKNQEELESFANMMRDRFGPIPDETLGLFEAIKLRWLTAKLGFEKVMLKSGKFIGYFISNPESSYYNSDVFNKVLQFVQKNPRLCKIKETKNKLSLTIKNIKSINDALDHLKQIE